MINGMLYLSVPDHVWAIDARTGREIWHYFWKTRGGDHIGNRGVGMYGKWLYFLTPDNYFVSLEAATGKERWHQEIANMKREYFSTNAPIDHRQAGPHRRRRRRARHSRLSRVARSGKRRISSGASTRRRAPASRERKPGRTSTPMLGGGGMPWIPGTYDPELNLYYFGTGNPNPVLAGHSRRGDNLYTCTIVALNPTPGRWRGTTR